LQHPGEDDTVMEADMKYLMEQEENCIRVGSHQWQSFSEFYKWIVLQTFPSNGFLSLMMS